MNMIKIISITETWSKSGDIEKNSLCQLKKILNDIRPQVLIGLNGQMIYQILIATAKY